MEFGLRHGLKEQFSVKYGSFCCKSGLGAMYLNLNLAGFMNTILCQPEPKLNFTKFNQDLSLLSEPS